MTYYIQSCTILGVNIHVFNCRTTNMTDFWKFLPIPQGTYVTVYIPYFLKSKVLNSEILVQTVLEKRLWMYNFYSVKIFSFFENEIAKMDNQQGPTVQHMELCSMSCGSLDGRGAWGRMDTSICMTESLCCSPEIVAELLTGYTTTQNKKFKRKENEIAINQHDRRQKNTKILYRKLSTICDIRRICKLNDYTNFLSKAKGDLFEINII